MVKNLPAMSETWVRSLGREYPLEEGMATHSSILAWKIPMDREAWRATSNEIAKSWTGLSNLHMQVFTFINSLSIHLLMDTKVASTS